MYFNFLIQANLTLGVLVLLYLLALRKTVSFQLNRFLLLGFLGFSLVIPFIPKPVSPFQQVQVERFKESTEVSLEDTNFIDLEDVILSEQIEESYAQIEWELLLITFYILGSISNLLWFLGQTVKLSKMKRKAEIKTWQGKKFFYLSESVGSFSFFNSIFLNSSWTEMNNYNKTLIYEHELIHSEQLHSFDLVLVELCKIFFWINPAIWILKRELQIQHEYYVDKAVLSKYDASRYAELLLNLSKTNYNKHTITSSISNFSTLKQRINMMSQTKSLIQQWRYVLLIPAFSLVLFACSTFDEVDNTTFDLSSTENSIQKVTLNGKQVSFDKAVEYHRLSLQGKADFEVHLSDFENKSSLLKITLALGSKPLLHKEYAIDAAEDIQKIALPDLLSDEISKRKYPTGNPRLIIEAGDDAITIPVLMGDKVVQESNFASILINGKEVEILDGLRLSKGVSYGEILSAGKANFEIHLKEETDNKSKVIVTLAKGSRPLFSRKISSIDSEKKKVHSLEVPDLLSKNVQNYDYEGGDPRLIIEVDGQAFTIPVFMDETQSQGNASSNIENEKIHIVTKGETLFQVARKYGISVNELHRLNPSVKRDFSGWKVGVELKLSDS